MIRAQTRKAAALESASYNRTERAKNLVDDDFWRNEMTQLQHELLQAIANSGPHDADQREMLYQKHRALVEVVAHFESLAATANIKAKRLRIL